MRQFSTGTRRPARKVVQTTALAAVLAATGVGVAGAAPAAVQQAVKPRLDYTCAFPSGSQQVVAQVRATFPESGTVGRPIQPANSAITVAIPHAAIAGLVQAGATTVTATASLAIKVTQNGATATSAWAGLKTPFTRLPATGPLLLAASGAAPAATVEAPGDVTFTAAGLALVLVPHQPAGAAMRASAMPVECALGSGQAAALATVPVAGAASTSGPGRHITVTPPASGSQRGTPLRSGKTFCPPLPPKGLKLNPRFPPPKPPPGSQVLPPSPITGCAYVIGFSDVRKLKGAALIGPGLTNLEVGLRVIINQKVNYLQIDNAGLLEFHGLHEFPPATATLLAFGFMPVTATLQLKQIGTLDAYAVGPVSPINCGKCITTTTIYSLLTLRIYNVKVNGVPLNVGDSCQTANPFAVKVVGTSPSYGIETGGPLSGMITIPPFRGCGTGENLDPIFNASISGPGNFVKLTQGTLCTPNSGTGCPPSVPKPQR
jgi:hypothetical protein